MSSMNRTDRGLRMHTADERQTTDPIDFGSFMEQREAAEREFAAGDVEPLRRVATSHPPATLFGPGGETRLGPDRVFDAYTQVATAAAGGDTHFDVLQSAASDGLAYWVGLQHSTMRVADSDAPRHVVLRVTELFRREKGEWKLIHRHADELEASR
jgi:ketosteroid isomerase-like protein